MGPSNGYPFINAWSHGGAKKRGGDMTFDMILEDLKRISKEWVESNYALYITEGLDEKQRGFIRHPPKNISISDPILTEFFMVASIQHGGDWFFWFERNRPSTNTIKLLVSLLSISYKRVLYRVLYILQIFDANELHHEIELQSAHIPQDVLFLVHNYVENKWVLDYLEILSKNSDEGTRSRAASVISEIVKYSPYQFPRKEMQKPKIFISYNHKDAGFVNDILRRFEEAHMGVIIDANNLKFGEDINEFIKISTANTQFTLSIVSKNSLLSPWVILETLEALVHERVDKNIKYLPVIIDNSVIDNTFYQEAKTIIRKGIHELVELIYKESKELNHTKSLENQKGRLIELLNNFDTVIDRLKTHLFIDFSTSENIEKNFPKLVEQIKEIVHADS
jgi:hypothetical protein